MASGASSHAPYYFVPGPSKWPLVGGIALTFFGFGLASWFNGASFGPYLFAIDPDARVSAIEEPGALLLLLFNRWGAAGALLRWAAAYPGEIFSGWQALSD